MSGWAAITAGTLVLDLPTCSIAATESARLRYRQASGAVVSQLPADARRTPAVRPRGPVLGSKGRVMTARGYLLATLAVCATAVWLITHYWYWL
jgi:hypothetical protein